MKKLKIVLLLALCSVMLACTACAPSMDSLKKKFEDEGYTVITVTADTLKSLGLESEDIESGMNATKISLTDPNTVTIIWFKDSGKAKDFAEKRKEEDKDSKNIIRKGKMVAFGTTDALDII